MSTQSLLVCVVAALLCAAPALAAIAACSEETQSRVNPAFQSTATAKWSELSDETEFRRFRLERVAGAVPEFQASAFSGRGVVMAVTAHADIASAHVALSQLRATGSVLPVEIAHQGIITAAVADELELIPNVRVRDVRATGEEATSIAHAALLSSAFADVLYMSPRTFALADPASLFESAEFTSTGVVMWPSLYKTSPANPIWAMVGSACIDTAEQTAAAFLVSKERAWAALHTASHLSGAFYQSMLHGDDSSLYFGALVTGTASVFAPASKAVAGEYMINGVRTACAHSVVLSSFTGSALFMVSANKEVVMSGSTADGIACLANVEAVPHDEAVVAQLVRLQASVPENSGRIAMQACTVGTPSQTLYESYVNVGGVFYEYATSTSNLGTGSSVYVVTSSPTPTSNWIPSCGSFFRCTNTFGYNSDIRILFFNVTTVGRSANLDISTPTTRDNRWIQYGNETYLRVMDHSLQRDQCRAPIVGFSDSYVSGYNIVSGGAAVVAVAWNAEFPRTVPITIKIRYNGPSNAAFSQATISAPLVIAVAALVALITQRF